MELFGAFLWLAALVAIAATFVRLAWLKRPLDHAYLYLASVDAALFLVFYFVTRDQSSTAPFMVFLGNSAIFSFFLSLPLIFCGLGVLALSVLHKRSLLYVCAGLALNLIPLAYLLSPR